MKNRRNVIFASWALFAVGVVSIFAFNIAHAPAQGGDILRSSTPSTVSLRQIARVFCPNEAAVDETIAACQRRVREQHDDILAAV